MSEVAAAGAVVLQGSARRRVAAMVLRYWYLLRSSWPRMAELAYWPTVQMIVWGFLSRHLATDSDWLAQAAGVLIAAVLLWDVLFRGQLGMSIPFLEEMWSRNLGQLFVSPLRPREWVLSLATVSVIRTSIGVVPAALLAIPFFGFSVFGLGIPLVGFFALLLLAGWWVSLIVISLVLRYGLGAEALAWAVVFLLLPVSCVYYPVDVLPVPLRVVALALPTTHVFEGMRDVLFGHGFSWGHFGAAAALDVAYGALGGLVFARAFEDARDRGALLQQGE